MAGHLGVRKTQDRILNHFWWPTLRKDVSEYCRSCHTCQVVGKPNQKIPTASLKPILAFDEPPGARGPLECQEGYQARPKII